MGADNPTTLTVDEKVVGPTLSNLLSDPENENSKQPQVGYIFHQLLCFLWLAPAAALLYLNLSQYIVGASIGCFSCRLNPFSSSTFEEESKLDRRDHTAVGGLQFASKAMEIWFMIVAAGIIYDMLVLLTKKGKDMPLGMLARYIGFGDILGLADYPPGKKTHAHHFFLVFVAFMCIVANLIGPSTAVLMIPTIQWIDTSFQNRGTFTGFVSQQSPQVNAILNECTAELLAAGNYSCTASPYGFSLDQLFASVAVSLQQIGQTEILFDPVISQEHQVSFIVNTTDADVDWIPSRQVADEISDDYLQYQKGVKNAQPHSNYSKLSNSLSTILLRQGPLIGLAGGCYRGSMTNVTLAADKGVRCYGGWDLYAEEGTSYVKCIPVGSGWDGPLSHSQFNLGNPNGQDTFVDVYFADHVYTPASSNDGSCFVNGSPQGDANCDWSKAFLAAPPTTRVTNTSTNIVLVEYTEPSVKNGDTTVWCDDIPYLGFQEYSMDPSPFSNFIHLTQLENADPKVAPNAIPLVVHTDWFLAGWSVNHGGTVNETRIAAQTMIRLVQEAYTNTSSTLDLSTLNFMDGVAADQALSMIPYTSNSSVSARGNTFALTTSAKIQVWAYGLGSHTSILGTVVLFIAIVCVMLRTVVALLVVLERDGRFTTPAPLGKLIVAALEHPPLRRIEEHKARFSIQKRTVSFSHGD